VGATTGPVIVTTAGQASNSLSYTIVDGPQLSHLAPSWGPVATTVTLHGTNFGTAGSVMWHQDRDAPSGWIPVAHVSGTWADTSVQVVIPSGLATGFFTVERAGALSNGSPYTVGTEEVQYHHTDGIGSLRLVTGVQGHVLARHEYQPFGEEWLASPGNEDRIGFWGKELDKETGSGGWAALNDFGARYLHGATGRFTNVDPVLATDRSILDPQSWNRYVYVRNNPVRYVDPDGRLDYEATLLGRSLPVHIDDRLSKARQRELQKLVDAGIDTINKAKGLTGREKLIIKNIRTLTIDGSKKRSFVDERTNQLTLTPDFVLESSDEYLGSAIAHDGKHIDLFNRGGTSASRGLKAEVAAMQFQLEVGRKIGLSPDEERYIEGLIGNPEQLRQYVESQP
jgi:RHS repeat-associated protein